MAKQDKKKNMSGAFGKLMSSNYQIDENPQEISHKTEEKPEKRIEAGQEKKKSKMLEGLKNKKKEYQLVRIEQNLYDDYVKIAEENDMSFPGRLINFALKKWIEEYQEEIERL
jgi:hypothetical protein